MNKRELKAFRAKLVKARRASEKINWLSLRHALYAVGFKWDDAKAMGDKVGDWYYAQPNARREALWDNSIAAIDAQIRSKP